MKKRFLWLLIAGMTLMMSCEKKLFHFVINLQKETLIEIDQTGAFTGEARITGTDIRRALDIPDDARIPLLIFPLMEIRRSGHFFSIEKKCPLRFHGSLRLSWYPPGCSWYSLTTLRSPGFPADTTRAWSFIAARFNKLVIPGFSLHNHFSDLYKGIFTGGDGEGREQHVGVRRIFGERRRSGRRWDQVSGGDQQSGECC